MGKIRVGVIGAGWYAAESHIPVLAGRDDVALDGVCRLGAAELDRVRAHFGFAFASEDHRAVLARRPEAAIVASPHHLHYVHARDAIEAGCHVLVEKPMTLDPAAAWDLVARARARGRHLLVANGYHYRPHLAALRGLLGEAIGPIEHVACSFVSATRRVFEGEAGLGRWATSFFRPDRATWQDPRQGGGFAYGQLSHSIALTLWLTGLAPVSVAAATAPREVDLFDAASVGFANGAIGTFSGAAGWPEGQRALLTLALVGRDGAAELALHRDHLSIARHDGREIRLDVAPGDWVYRCDGPVHALIDLAKGGGENLSPGEVGASTVDVIEAMLQSSRLGIRVEIAPRIQAALARAS
jgi:predicted dehydrogenase